MLCAVWNVMCPAGSMSCLAWTDTASKFTVSDKHLYWFGIGSSLIWLMTLHQWPGHSRSTIYSRGCLQYFFFSSILPPSNSRWTPSNVTQFAGDDLWTVYYVVESKWIVTVAWPDVPLPQISLSPFIFCREDVGTWFATRNRNGRIAPHIVHMHMLCMLCIAESLLILVFNNGRICMCVPTTYKWTNDMILIQHNDQIGRLVTRLNLTDPHFV